jgi:murein DD-endopeptidase MepM/ murein hydrolase activator NlpD
MPTRKNENLAPSIDAYLAKRGSPMAGQGMAFLRAGRKFGVDPRLLVGIATIESGAGAHIKLPYNPFNWGVHRGQTYGSWEESIMDVARGLRRGYLDKGLKNPQQIVSRYAPSSDGNDESNWAKVVGQVMSQLGGNVPAGVPHTQGQRSAAALSPSPLPPQAPTYKTEFDPALFSRQIRDQFIAGKGRIDLFGLGPTRAASYKEVELPPPPQLQEQAQQAKPGSNFVPTHAAQPGKGINLPWEYKSTHVTDGLTDEGFTRAIDIMGSPGTPVFSPQGGTVIYFHPTGAQGGGSMLVRFKDGREGWIGHIENGLPAGTKFKAGSQLADISPDHPRPHVHWSLR